MAKRKTKFPRALIVWEDCDEHDPDLRWFVAEKDAANVAEAGEEKLVALYRFEKMVRVVAPVRIEDA